MCEVGIRQYNDKEREIYCVWVSVSVIRFGDLLTFGKLLKTCGNNYFAHILGNFLKMSKKSFIFLVKSFLGYFL